MNFFSKVIGLAAIATLTLVSCSKEKAEPQSSYEGVWTLTETSDGNMSKEVLTLTKDAFVIEISSKAATETDWKFKGRIKGAIVDQKTAFGITLTEFTQINKLGILETLKEGDIGFDAIKKMFTSFPYKLEGNKLTISFQGDMKVYTR